MKDEALKLALEALEYTTTMSKFLLDKDANIGPILKAEKAITAVKQALAAPVQKPDRVRECAQRLVEHADFRLGGVLSADSKAKDIPSKAVSQVKARHLASLRDALAAAPPAQPATVQELLSELEKDAAYLLFALHDAWPYVHQHCTIQSKKKFIQALIVKHGDFADLQPPAARPAPVQEPVAIGWDTKTDTPIMGYTTPPAQPAPVQEPVAIYQYQLANGSWIDQDKFSYDYNVRLNQATVRIVYTTPPAAKRPWVGLTDEEIYDCDEANACRSALAYAIEAKLKERNT